jgi:hypothetical protein
MEFFLLHLDNHSIESNQGVHEGPKPKDSQSFFLASAIFWGNNYNDLDFKGETEHQVMET